ncbi:MAG: hypothetical protein K0U89_22840, partial [Planctomycetes bacterium]|nr:hypothetical protein [Planctomycetota bacterium]
MKHTILLKTALHFLAFTAIQTAEVVGQTTAKPELAAFTSRDDSKWLRENGTLIFHDAFEREEDGNLAGAIGNGWNSATANRVPDMKMANLDKGILKVA